MNIWGKGKLRWKVQVCRMKAENFCTLQIILSLREYGTIPKLQS